MKYILAQPASLRFQWELDVVLTNIYSLDREADIVCLFGRTGGESAEDLVGSLKRRYPTLETHIYDDRREYLMYAPTIRPYLWTLYLADDRSREQETYFQIDSDIIFRELPDFDKIPFNEKAWYGSDCGYYIDYEYLKMLQGGEDIVDNFARIIGIDRKVIEKTEGAGAQWILVKPTLEYWEKVYKDCISLWQYLEGVDSNIQKWTAEMWAQLYNAPFFGIEQKIHKELDFCRPTDKLDRWNSTKILHNAGVIGELEDSLFFKTKYVYNTPFSDDLSHVDKERASIKYVEAIKKVVI